jgi:peptidyl-dipeptidase A
MHSLRTTALAAALVLIPTFPPGDAASPSGVEAFLEEYGRTFRLLAARADSAAWLANVDIRPEHTEARISTERELAAFTGGVDVIEECRGFLDSGEDLSALQRRQLERILYTAAHAPGTIPDVVAELVEAEARQNDDLYGFTFHLPDPDGEPEPVTTNQIDDLLVESRDLDERLRVWRASKEVGPELKEGLVRLRDLRNRCAREMGYSSYFALEVANYGMTTSELLGLTESVLEDLRPLYEQLHCWVKHRLAERYGAEVPRRIPAHWLGNRWGQSWPGIVEGVDLDDLFEGRPPSWLVEQAERFYVSMGFPELPASFWARSDLYDLPPDAERKKNTHASAWHIDLESDVRSLMSVKANASWFATTHHELGHIYYYLAYARPEVPYPLRRGANRAFHEGIGSLIELAALQVPYLRAIGLLGGDREIDPVEWLLNEALTGAVVFLPWSFGVMTHWEHDFYEEELPPEEFNRRWWHYVQKYQGIDPPEPRGEEWCDPATKTHVNNDPAQYYDYGLSTLLLHQMHDHIARRILERDPHACSYYGHEEVGDFLRPILSVGATRDWRELLRESLGEEMSARAMMDYFAPLRSFLETQNEGLDVSFE